MNAETHAPVVFESQPISVAKLDLNERSEGPPSWANEAIAAMPQDLFWRYIERQPLEAKIAALYDIPKDQVLATNGGDEGILYLYSALPQGAPLITPRPTFGLYHEQAKIWDSNEIVVPSKEDLSLDMEAVRTCIGKNQHGMLVLVRPNNPTGESIPRGEMIHLLEFCLENNTLVLLDEAYGEFAEDNLVSELNRFPNLVILRTFSKAYGLAGLRIGYLLGQPICKLKPRVLPYNVASASLYFAGWAIDQIADMQCYVEKVKQNRAELRSLLCSLNIPTPESQANFLLLPTTPLRAQFLAGALKNEGILVRTFQSEDLNHCIRISIPAEVRTLTAALKKVLEPQQICLDVDGCLIDVSNSFDMVNEATVRHFTGETIQRSEILELRAAGGFNDDNVLSLELIKRRGKQPDLNEVKRVFRSFYIGDDSQNGLYLKEAPLIKRELLQHLLTRYKAALVTGRNKEEAALAVPILNLPPETPIITVDDVTLGKPHPEGILIASKNAGAERYWMVGDNKDDILAARASGAVAIGISTENRDALLAAGAAIVLEDINQLEELL